MGLPVKGYPMYEVFENGTIYSKYSKKILKPSYTDAGYATVELFNNGKSKRKLVHRIVAEAYIDNPNCYEQINHIDENKANNHVNNLEWCTAKYNMNYGKAAIERHKNVDYSKPIYKTNAVINGRKVSKPIMQFSKDGKYITTFASAEAAKRKLNVRYAHISECALGKRKTAHGFVWRYERSDDLSVYQY